MRDFEENEIKISNYFDGIMSTTEEQGFMQELASDKTLRKQYEDELLMRGLFTPEKEELITDDILLTASENDSHNLPPEPAKIKSSNGLLKKLLNIKNIAAAILAIAFVTIIFKLMHDKRQPVANPDDTISKTAIIKKVPAIPADSVVDLPKIPENVFNKFYAPYSGKEDPVEISNYYADYKNGNYDKVVAAKDADYQTMGINDRGDLLKQYMLLYKGLSYLQQDNPAAAILQFDQVLKRSAKTISPYYESQWYGTLARLKTNEPTAAVDMARQIAQSSSPYKNKAALLINELKQ